MNTLADFIATHDNQYETLIYRPFTVNPYFKVLPEGIFEGEGFQEFVQLNFPDPEYSMREESKINQVEESYIRSNNCMFDALNANMQTYFKEAVETYEVKIYELSLICADSIHSFNFC